MASRANGPEPAGQGWDTLGGPDREEREDELGGPDRPAVADTLGGPDLVFDPAPGVTLSTEDETTLRALFSTSFELYGTERLLLLRRGGTTS